MAHLHFKRTVYKSGGGTARARIEYITRHPVRELDRGAQQLRYIQNDREDLVYTNSRNLPAWADGKPHVYFKAAEQYERANGVAFEEWKITLPREFTHRDNMALTRDLVDAIAGDTLPMVYAFHDPVALDGEQQPHLHLLLSARKTDAQTRTPEQHFTRYNRAHPERGGAEKDPAFSHHGAVKAWRVLVSDLVNIHLEGRGLDARIHPASLESRGIERPPEPKLLPSESQAYREQGIISPRMQDVLATRGRSLHDKQSERRNTWAYWLQRKTELGIESGMSLHEQLACAIEARRFLVAHPPDPLSTLEALQALLESQHPRHVQVERFSQAYRERQERQKRYERQQGQREQDEKRHAVQRSLRRLTQRLQEQEAGSALNVRIPRLDTEREQGMGL